MRETINDVIHATDPTQVLVATPLKAQVSSYYYCYQNTYLTYSMIPYINMIYKSFFQRYVT